MFFNFINFFSLTIKIYHKIKMGKRQARDLVDRDQLDDESDDAPAGNF